MSHTSDSTTSGVYIITCLPTGKIYVGSSINIAKRWSDHRTALRQGLHRNPYLQNAWNKYGERAFTFTVCEYVNPATMIAREQYWLDTLQPYENRGFNISMQAQAGMGGRKHTPETRAKLSAMRTGKKAKPETVAKRATSNRGKKRSPEFCDRLREVNSGKTHSEEARAKMRAAKVGKRLPSEVYERQAESRRSTYVFTTPDGLEIIAKGLAKFCHTHNLSSGAMSEVASGKRLQYKGWKCRHLE